MLYQEDLEALLAVALEARRRTYSPYSQFGVGAAVRTANGRIFPGCNVENAAYPSTICAERVALTSAYASGEREIVAIAVVADTSGPVSPCGTCRQVMLELAPNAQVLLANLHGDTQLTSPQELLPFGFDAEELPKK